jgi:hypothetical protein
MSRKKNKKQKTKTKKKKKKITPQVRKESEEFMLLGIFLPCLRKLEWWGLVHSPSQFV